MTQAEKHLYSLDELSDYKISDGYPDIRGWDVKDVDNRVIGKVDNLLVNKDAERVVYLDVDVDKTIIDAKHDPYGRPSHVEVREFVNKDGDNHIIIPIGLVDINSDSKYVYTNTIDHLTFSETKRYSKGDNVNRAYEVQVLDSYERRRKPETVEHKVVADEIVDRKWNVDETRIRDIVREEIRRYNDDRLEYRTATERDLEIERRRQNDVIYDDDRFYERREFDDDRFKKHTPGL